MNREATDFAEHRFTPRTGYGKARDAYAVEHYAPHTEHRAWAVVRALICIAAAAAIGALAAQGV
jgi:hypothetical protein